MKRRRFLQVSGVVTATALTSGCLGDDGDDEDPPADDDDDAGDADDGDDDDGPDPAEQMIETIEEDLSVESWSDEAETLSVEYVTSGEIAEDALVLGTAYASAVAGGLEADIEGTAVEESGDESYDVEIEREWAEEFLEEEISDDEYINRIRGTTLE